eukprot:13192628-Ditylum_brightwellii.AAC.1
MLLLTNKTPRPSIWRYRPDKSRGVWACFTEQLVRGSLHSGEEISNKSLTGHALVYHCKVMNSNAD